MSQDRALPKNDSDARYVPRDWITVCGAKIRYAAVLAIFCHAEKSPPRHYVLTTSSCSGRVAPFAC